MIRCTDTKQHAAEIIRLSLATWPIALTPTRPYTWRPHADDTYTYTAARTSARAAWRFVCCVAIRWASKHLVAWPRSHLSLLLYPAVYVLLPTSLHIKTDSYSLNVADVVAVPYFERPAGPTWRCHIPAGHPAIDSWLRNMHQLHPAIRMAFRDESRLMSEKMRHLFLYEVLVRVAGGLLFELLGQSVGDRERDEDDIPIVVGHVKPKILS
ncbi:uncharacterized protein LOC144563437 [Carex rostrata]